MSIKTLFGGLVALGFIAVSTVMAARFGWSLGSSEIDRWLYGTAGGLADVLKALLPLFIVAAWVGRQYMRVTLATAAFLVFTGYSLVSSFGLAAIQRADKLGEHTAVAAVYEDRKREVDRLLAQRGQLPAFVPATAEAVKAAQDAVDAAEKSRADECRSRGRFCRQRETEEAGKRSDLGTVMANHELTKQAARIDSAIEAARAKLGSIDTRVAKSEADPQAAAISRLTGGNEELVRTGLHAMIAILVELGSGLGLYLVFGHRVHAAERRQSMPVQVQQPVATYAVDEPMTIEGPEDAIQRFVIENVRPTQDARITGAEMYAAYEAWAEGQGLEPLSPAMFGRLMPWRKDRIGGRVWYLDAALPGRVMVPALRVAVDNTARSARLGAMTAAVTKGLTISG